MFRTRNAVASTLAALALASGLAAPQQPAAPPVGPPMPLAIKAEWKPNAPDQAGHQEPLTQARLLNGEKLELHMYGTYLPEGLLFSHQFAEQVPHVFNGLCQVTCALLVSDRANF